MSENPINWMPEYDPNAERHAQWLREVAYAVREADIAVVEQTCEAAIQGGEHGVLVGYKQGRLALCEVHPSVPYGMVHEYEMEEES